MGFNIKTLLKVSLLSALLALASCGGGGGGNTGGGTTSTYGAYTSPNILASEFVSALNAKDGTYSSKVELYTNETVRSSQAGQEQWFVIWDAKYSEYKAVSLQYVRSIVYYDWKNQNLYNFVNWKHQFKNYYLYLMAYSNPKYFNLPQQSGAGTLYSGKGFQIMLVYNY